MRETGAQEVGIVRRQIGDLPAMWPRSAVFFANLLGIFFGNRECVRVMRERIGTVRSYSGRMVPILNLIYKEQKNLLIVEREPNPSLVSYFRDCLGLSLPEIAVAPENTVYDHDGSDVDEHDPLWRRLAERVRQHPAPWLDALVTDEAMVRLAAAAGKKLSSNPAAGRAGNNKRLLHFHAEAAGLPVFDTLLAHAPSEVSECLEALRAKGYRRAVVKSEIGASGIGMIRVPTGDAPIVPEYLFLEGPALVQGWLDETCSGVRFIGSPSVQLFLTDSDLVLYDLTEQVLSPESVHEGNIAPPPFLEGVPATRDELLRQAEMAGSWLHRLGYRGPASADFHVIDRAGRHEVRLCELNARVTGATYPSLLARHFAPSEAWIMRNVRFHPAQPGSVILNRLDEAGFLFRPETREGLFPINFNLDAENLVNKGQFLAPAASVEEAERCFAGLHHAGILPWEYEGD